MNGSQILELLNQIAATSSRLEKEALLQKHKDDHDLKQTVLFAYEPSYTYFIDAIPADEELREHSDDRVTKALNYNFLYMGETFAYLEGVVSGRSKAPNSDVGRVHLCYELARLHPDAREILRRILKKDLRAGIGEGTIHKVWPGLIKKFPYMRCSLMDKSNFDKWKWEDGIYVQLKADGMFLRIDVDDAGHVSYSSRQGTPILNDAFHEVTSAVRYMNVKGVQLHGEAIVENAVERYELPREESNGVMNSIASGGALAEEHRIVVYLWDMIPTNDLQAERCDTPYKDRLHALNEALDNLAPADPVRLIPTSLVKLKAEAFKLYGEFLKLGKEGAICKDPNSIWKHGTSKDQVKLKLEVDVELEVIDFVEGEGKYQGMLGAWVMASKCRKLKVNVNGRTDDLRAAVWNDKLDWLGAITTVRANSIMKPSEPDGMHSLFLPRFIERRTDKLEADTLEQIEDQFRNAMEPT